MKKILLVLLFLLPFISACQFLLDEYLIEDLGNDDYMCINNFHCIVDLPKEVFVGIELFSSDTLLLVYKRFPESNYVSLPGPKDTLEFGSDLILRLHIFCNGKKFSKT